jgi:hypothetical protein
MKVTFAERKSHRLGLLWVALAGALILSGVAWIVTDQAELPLAWDAVVFFGWLPPYLYLAALAVGKAGTRTQWRMLVANEWEHHIDVLLRPSLVPPFGRYEVLFDDAVVLRKREGWGVEDRLAFSITTDRTHEVAATIRNTNVFPLRAVRFELDVDGERLAGL